MTVKMLAERRTGRLLGVQIVGREGAGKRVDIAAVALTAGMTVEQMTALDLGYAPPFSPVWDPILVAARKATACGALLGTLTGASRGAGLRDGSATDPRADTAQAPHGAPVTQPTYPRSDRSPAEPVRRPAEPATRRPKRTRSQPGAPSAPQRASRAPRRPSRPQPMADRLVQRHRPLHLRRQPPGLLAERGHVFPGQSHHQRDLGLTIGRGVHRRGNSVVHRLFLT